MSDHLTTALALEAWQAAIQTRSAPAIHHSDRGCQYTSGAYQQALADAGTRCSMSRKGNCWDNAVAESAFATIKTELVHQERFETRAAARAAVADYIDGFYNPRRQHSANNYLSPVDFESQAGRTSAAMLR